MVDVVQMRHTQKLTHRLSTPGVCDEHLHGCQEDTASILILLLIVLVLHWHQHPPHSPLEVCMVIAPISRPHLLTQNLSSHRSGPRMTPKAANFASSQIPR